MDDDVRQADEQYEDTLLPPDPVIAPQNASPHHEDDLSTEEWLQIIADHEANHAQEEKPEAPVSAEEKRNRMIQARLKKFGNSTAIKTASTSEKTDNRPLPR